MMHMRCPGCGQKLRCSANVPPETAKCPKCGRAFPLGGHRSDRETESAAQQARRSNPVRKGALAALVVAGAVVLVLLGYEVGNRPRPAPPPPLRQHKDNLAASAPAVPPHPATQKIVLASQAATQTVKTLIGDATASSPKAQELSPAEVFSAASPSVVRVIASISKGRESRGSGFFVSEDGYLVTNYHVIEEAESAEVVLHDGSKVPVLGAVCVDGNIDLAILYVGRGPHRFLALEGNTPPQVGTRVIAIGNPEGFVNTLSEGIVSGYREIDGVPLVQTTAAISGGSSGGPLLSLGGKVVGVTTASWGTGQNLNFAISYEYVRRLLNAKGMVQGLSVAAAEPGIFTRRQREEEARIKEERRREREAKIAEAARILQQQQEELDRLKNDPETRRKARLEQIAAQLAVVQAAGKAAEATKAELERQYNVEVAEVNAKYDQDVRAARELSDRYKIADAIAIAQARRDGRLAGTKARYQPQAIAIQDRINSLFQEQQRLYEEQNRLQKDKSK